MTPEVTLSLHASTLFTPKVAKRSCSATPRQVLKGFPLIPSQKFMVGGAVSTTMKYFLVILITRSPASLTGGFA